MNFRSFSKGDFIFVFAIFFSNVEMVEMGTSVSV